MQEIWVQAFAAVFEAVLIYYWVRAFSKNKANKRIQIIFEVAGVSVWIFMSLVFLKNPLALISFTAIGCIVIFGIYHVPWKIGFVATLIFCVIMALCDVLSTYAVMMFSNESIEHIRFAPKYMLISNIITKFLLLSFVSFVYVHWKADINRLSMRRVIYLLILPIASIAILSQMLRFNDFNNPISIIMCVFGIVGLFIGNIYSFTFFEKEENLQKQQLRGLYLEQQIENQRLYYRNLEASNEEIRKIRHDLKNAFAALSGYLNAENIEDAKKYVDKQVENLGELTYNTGHPAVDAVINNKKSRANELQIQFDVNIWLPEDLHIDEMDLCIILGNALDNALEACEKMPCGQGEIILSLRKTGEMLLIDIKNTFDEKPVKDSDGLVTTKKDQINHGFGLKTIHQLTKQYDGTMDYEVKNGWFYLVINLNFKDPVNSVR
ncbi:sensor histidine kinase [Eubacterium limosum]|uniref:sensor histidine kinase n=1 Tax=Eubacterium limosum TaxID=1736 RepID=UPI0010640CAD|nr:sensor histidine kinase [Eubacterium limosum]